jgi:predicted dehydrogenase
MTTLTPEERALGRSNANVALGVTRRDFLKAAAVAPALGAFYFGYEGIDRPVRAAIIGTGNEGCGAMIHDHNRKYLDFIGFCDIRPTQQVRARKEFANHADYGPADAEKIKMYADEAEMLADPDVEVVVIALPLWLHSPVALRAMRAGKHVFSEKLMAHNIAQCKAMCRVARETNKLLAVGHQRHYSTLYDNANFLVANGHLGTIRHIRAQWHRNNACPRQAKEPDGKPAFDKATGEPIWVRDEAGNIVYFDGWKPDIPKDDLNVDFAKYGYKSLDELVRWRLYNRTGAGLMAELGSHQLDACSIFLGKAHPLAVTGMGGTWFYKDGREADDHVFTSFEFPAPDDPDKDRVVVTYSSINTNSFPGSPLDYGEMVMGSRGTMIVAGERDMLLYKEIDRNNYKGGTQRSTSITMENRGGKPAMETSPSLAGQTGVAVPGTVDGEIPSRGYREELEHFAFCVRRGNPADFYGVLESADEEQKRLLMPRCRGEIAMADAIVALTSNIAMRENRRIAFEEAWFDFTQDDVPDGSKIDEEMKV